MRALLATVERGPALGAVTFPVQIGRQHGGAIETSRGNHVLQQPGKARTCNVDRWTRPGRLRPVSGSAVSGSITGILVSALSIFSIVVHVSNRLLEIVPSHYRWLRRWPSHARASAVCRINSEGFCGNRQGNLERRIPLAPNMYVPRNALRSYRNHRFNQPPRNFTR
jgi:hypothetical protein